MNTPAPPAPIRHNSREAARLVHDLWKQRIDVDYRRADTRLRIAGGLGVVILIGGLIVGESIGRKEVVGIAVAVGLLTFIIALFKASGNYKRSYRKFVLEHMADDGTFLFCPSCKAPIADPNDPASKTDPPAACPHCDAGPWRFERPVENPKHAAQQTKREARNHGKHGKH